MLYTEKFAAVGALLLTYFWFFRGLILSDPGAAIGLAEYLTAAGTGRNPETIPLNQVSKTLNQVASWYFSVVYGDAQMPKSFRGFRLLLTSIWVGAGYGFFSIVLWRAFFTVIGTTTPIWLDWLFAASVIGFVADVCAASIFAVFAKIRKIPASYQERKDAALAIILSSSKTYAELQQLKSSRVCPGTPWWWIYGGNRGFFVTRMLFYAKRVWFRGVIFLSVMLLAAHIFSHTSITRATTAMLCVVALGTFWIALMDAFQKFSEWKGAANSTAISFPLSALLSDC